MTELISDFRHFSSLPLSCILYMGSMCRGLSWNSLTIRDFSHGCDLLKITYNSIVEIQFLNFDFWNYVKQSENYDLEILNHLEQNPDTTQADLATQLGIAVGSVNWYLRRLVNKGYIKVTQMQRRRLRYLLTPKGLSEKARLTASFMQMSLHWYRETREISKNLLNEVKQAGYDAVCIEGDGDLAEIVYLSCLEAGITIKEGIDPVYPVFRIKEFKTTLVWPKAESMVTMEVAV